MSNFLDISTERVDDLPLLLAVLNHKMALATSLDQHFPTHRNWRGLSLGQVAAVWLAFVLCQGNHYLVKVQPWAASLLHTLQTCLGQPVRELDFSDDKLEAVLDNLALDGPWQAFEAEFNQDLLRVYDLRPTTVRIDSTSTYRYGSVSADGLFQFGHSKDHRGDLPQLKINLATLDPIGLPVSLTIVAGQRADDGLYLPEINRVRQMVSQRGLTYIGDCKMGALGVRAFVQDTQNFYLMPLAGVQLKGLEKELSEWVSAVGSGRQLTMALYAPDTPGGEDTSQVVALGFEQSRHQQTQVGTKTVEWQERLLIVQSPELAKRQAQARRNRLERTVTALSQLQPPKGQRGKKRYQQPTELLRVAQELVKKAELSEVLEVKVEAHPQSGELEVKTQLNEGEWEKQLAELGWRVYATNIKAEELSLQQAVWAYRSEYLIEHNFSRLKGRQLSVRPLQVRSDERVVGLLRLLSIGLRVLCLVEHEVRQRLAQEQASLSGLYGGNPRRRTARPSSESIFKAFAGINLSIVYTISGKEGHLTHLSPLQKRILELLGLPLQLYEQLANLLAKPHLNISEP